MLEILFVVSAMSVLLFLLGLVTDYRLPVPVLHRYKWGHFGNSLIYTPAIAYQIWFWATHFNLI